MAAGPQKPEARAEGTTVHTEVPPRGVDWTQATELTEPFSHTFIRLYPAAATAARRLNDHPLLTSDLYHTLVTHTSDILESARQGAIPAIDLFTFFHMAYAGQMPDDAIMIIDRHDPYLLADNRDGRDELLGLDRETTYHGLHMWDPKTLFRKRVGKRRTHEYATTPVSELLSNSTHERFIIRAPKNLATWLTGTLVNTAQANDNSPGIYASHDPIVFGKRIDVTFHSAVIYYRRNLSYREARRCATELTAAYKDNPSPIKIGLNSTTTGCTGTRYRPYSYGQQKTRPIALKIIAATSLAHAFEDVQTAPRLRRTEMLREDRARDEARVNKHTSDPGVLGHINSLIHALPEALKDSEKSQSILQALYPYDDGELLARTRIRWEQLVILLRDLHETHGTPALTGIVTGTGGLGLHGFAGVVLAYMVNTEARPLLAALIDCGVYANGLKKQSSVCKAIHNLTRRTGKLPAFIRGLSIPTWCNHPATHVHQLSSHRTHYMYLALLGGRAQDDLLGFDGYVEKRSKPPKPYALHTHTADGLQAQLLWERYSQQAYNRLGRLTTDVLQPRVDYGPDEFKASFINVAPLGSIGDAKHDLKSWLTDTHDAHKRLWLDSMPTDHLWEVLEKPPLLTTNAQVKTELGPKLRQIIPGPPDQWIVEAQVVHFLERAFYKSNPTLTLGASRWEVFLGHQERRQRAANGLLTAATDYDDFNWAHHVELMHRFWNRIGAAAHEMSGPGPWGGLNYPGHISRCCSWLAANLDRMYVREVGGDGKLHHVFQGLWSGWRTTSIINNFMNDLHDDVHSTALTRITQTPVFINRYKNGDDGDFAVYMMVVALLYVRQMALTGMQMQPSKQLFGTTNEFLRILGTGDNLHGNLNRSIGSFISSDLQDPIVDAGPEYTSGTMDSISILLRRGADLETINRIQTPILLTYARIHTALPDGSDRFVQLTNPAALYMPHSAGGFGCYRYLQFGHVKPPSSKPWPVTRAPWTLEGAPHYGVNAAMLRVYGRFNQAGITCDSYSRLHRDLISAATYGVDKREHTASDNIARNAIADHIVWLNKLSHSPKDNTVYYGLDEERQDIRIASALLWRKLLDEDYRLIREYNVLDFEDALATAAGRALGLASISPSLLKDLRDSKTLERISVREILARTESKGIPFGELNSYLHPQIVAAMLDQSYVMPTFYAGAIPADYLPAARVVIAHMLHRFYQEQSNIGHVKKEADSIILAAQAAIIGQIDRTDKHKLHM
jgi:hypothetical protein